MIENALIKLVGTDRFYADILMRLNRVITTRIPTAAVSLERGGTLYINPDFWAANEPHQVAILVHESLHLLFDHIGRAKETGAGALFNIAADLAINDIIQGFPNQATVEGKLADLATVSNFQRQFPDMEHNKAFEYYVDFLKQKGNQGEGGGQTMDDHSQWGETDLTPEEARQVVKDLIGRAIASTKNAGQQVPDGVRPYIEQLFDSGLSWEEILRSVPEATEISYFESSRKRRNRRYGLDFPGEKVVRKCEVVIGWDVSGSMTDELESKVGEVVKEIATKANVKVIFFDHAIQEEMDYVDGCLDRKTIPGGGGTLFAPVFERARELGADALIMLTDGMMADDFERPNFQTYWGIFEGFKCPVDWGCVVTVK
jgi:predicted metal-dependent peptidase